MSILTKPAGALVAALLLSACATVGPDFERPPAVTSPGYAMPGDTAPRLTAAAAGPWWRALGSSELNGVIESALANNPTIAEADAALQRAQAQAAAERGAAGPQAELTADAQRERINAAAFGFSGFPSPTLNLYSVGASVSYDLDLFGGRRRAIEAAEAAMEAERQRAEAARLSLTGNLALEALRIAALNTQIEAVQSIIADDRRVIEMVRRAEEAGGSAPSAVTGSRAQLAEDEALLPPLERELAAARHQLALLVGKSPAEWQAPDFRLADFAAPTAAPPALPSELLRRRPDVLASEAELHAATARIGVAQAAQYPNLRITAGLTQTALKPGDLFSYDATGWGVGPGLVAPLLDGGALKARRRGAEADARAALARYQGVVLRAFVQVSDVLSALAADERGLDALTRAERIATQRQQDAEAAFRLGGGSQLQVVDAQRQLSRARRALAQAQGQQAADVVQLYVATAADWRPN